MSTPQDPNEPLPTTPVGPSSPEAQGGQEQASTPQWGAPPPPPPGWGAPSAQPGAPASGGPPQPGPAAPARWGALPPPTGGGWGAPPPLPPGPQWPSGGGIPPAPPPRRDRLALAVVAFIFGGLFLVFFAFLLLAYAAVKGESPRLASGPRIGVLEVKGAIGMGRGTVDADEVLKQLKRFSRDDGMKAVVVRIDSPGGAVAPSQEIYDELKKLAQKKKVVCSMGTVAASGGLYVAMACEKIVAEPGTLTGSIGVITQFPNVTGLADRFDVKVETIKSGKLKDAGNPFREMTPEDRAYWQTLVDQVSSQFVRAVSEARALGEDEVKRFADGRVLTGEQALELKLIDALGNFHDAVDLAKGEAGLEGEPQLVYPPDERVRFLDDLIGGAVRSIAAEVRAEVGREVSGGGGPGVYYLAR